MAEQPYIITEPMYAGIAVIVASKMQNYPVDKSVSIPKKTVLIVAQNGKEVGRRLNIFDTPLNSNINKKNFKGLKKGLFSKEYKDVVLYWCHEYESSMLFNEAITTEKGRKGYFKGRLNFSYGSLFNFNNLSKVLREAKVKSNENSILVSEKLLREMIHDRVIEAMKTVLDSCPNYSYEVGVTKIPKDLKIVEKYVDSVVNKYGPLGSAHFVSLNAPRK